MLHILYAYVFLPTLVPENLNIQFRGVILFQPQKSFKSRFSYILDTFIILYFKFSASIRAHLIYRILVPRKSISKLKLFFGHKFPTSEVSNFVTHPQKTLMQLDKFECGLRRSEKSEILLVCKTTIGENVYKNGNLLRMSKNANLWENLLIDQELSNEIDNLTKPKDNRGVEAYRNRLITNTINWVTFNRSPSSNSVKTAYMQNMLKQHIPIEHIRLHIQFRVRIRIF